MLQCACALVPYRSTIGCRYGVGAGQTPGRGIHAGRPPCVRTPACVGSSAPLDRTQATGSSRAQPRPLDSCFCPARSMQSRVSLQSRATCNARHDTTGAVAKLHPQRDTWHGSCTAEEHVYAPFAALRRRTETGACRPTVQRGTTRWNPTRVAHRADTGTCTSAHNALAHADEDATAGLRQQGHARVPPLTFYPTLRFDTASRTVSCAAAPPPIRDSWSILILRTPSDPIVHSIRRCARDDCAMHRNCASSVQATCRPPPRVAGAAPHLRRTAATLLLKRERAQAARTADGTVHALAGRARRVGASITTPAGAVGSAGLRGSIANAVNGAPARRAD